MRAELDGWADSAAVGEYARMWFEKAAAGPLAPLFEQLRSLPKLSRHVFGSGASGKPWGEPNGLWASLLSFDQRHGKARSRRVWSDRTWSDFLNSMGGMADSVQLRIFELDERGVWSQDKVTVRAQRASDDGRWYRLVCETSTGPLGPNDRIASIGAEDFAAYTRECASEIPATFGCVTDDGGAGGETALEDRLRVEWDKGIQESRDLLRGYPWITVCAPEIVARLGGIRHLKSSGAFYELEGLATGSVWLQATERLDQYQDDALERVFETVAPALRPGEPKPYVNEHIHRLVYRDAAQI